jgi:D-alanyl-D-alanine carboxypeptidase
LLLGVLLVTSGARASEKQATYAKALKAQIPKIMKANAIPGALVLIRSRDHGDWSATFGTREIGKKDPVSIDDYFRIASNTKSMTGTVILQLVQEGKLDLGAPLSKFVPGFANGDKITIAQLCEMRSGLYSFTSDPGFNEALDKEPQKVWTPEALLAIARPRPALFSPGERFDYSNTNFVLLGVIIEQITGISLAEAFEKRLFEPLGLKHTSLPSRADASIPEPHAQGYQFLTNVATIDSYAVPHAELPAVFNGTLKPINSTSLNPSFSFAAGAVISTPGDLADFVEAMVGGRLLNEDTKALRLASVKPMNPANPAVGYGYGLIQFHPNLYGHDGQTPGYSSFMAHDPKAGITIIIGTNLSASPVNGGNAAIVVGKAVMGALYGTPSGAHIDPASVAERN